jgi:hypothetical protein
MRCAAEGRKDAPRTCAGLTTASDTASEVPDSPPKDSQAVTAKAKHKNNHLKFMARHPV